MTLDKLCQKVAEDWFLLLFDLALAYCHDYENDFLARNILSTVMYHLIIAVHDTNGRKEI